MALCLWPTKTKVAQLESESRSDLSPMPAGSFDSHCVRGLGSVLCEYKVLGAGLPFLSTRHSQQQTDEVGFLLLRAVAPFLLCLLGDEVRRTQCKVSTIRQRRPRHSLGVPDELVDWTTYFHTVACLSEKASAASIGVVNSPWKPQGDGVHCVPSADILCCQSSHCYTGCRSFCHPH